MDDVLNLDAIGHVIAAGDHGVGTLRLWRCRRKGAGRGPFRHSGRRCLRGGWLVYRARPARNRNASSAIRSSNPGLPRNTKPRSSGSCLTRGAGQPDTEVACQGSQALPDIDTGSTGEASGTLALPYGPHNRSPCRSPEAEVYSVLARGANRVGFSRTDSTGLTAILVEGGHGQPNRILG